MWRALDEMGDRPDNGSHIVWRSERLAAVEVTWRPERCVGGAPGVGSHVEGLAGVDVPNMQLQVVFLVGAAVAVGAAVWLLPGVRPDMEAKMVSPLTPSPAEWTRQAVSSQAWRGVQGRPQEVDVLGLSGVLQGARQGEGGQG